MENHQHVPPYPTSLPSMPGPMRPWWNRREAMLGGVAPVAVASFFLGSVSGGSAEPADSPDRLPPAEKGKSDAYWVIQNHTAGGDVTITDTPPGVACELAVKGVGFIRFYTAEESQAYVTACEQEFTTLAGQ
ncbi:hypothetical protein OOK48_00140 [Streptomyces viridodiastaticus]|uniref:hypothetical protein n=1 Tax=Streptomyces albogriseolus TaxID=1887 RepID=UPI002254BCC1|nr:hypothetical protein [Streptomyces viridodiastaticus]MCX4564766.1 hypothetical protein [Streptomyces viridodiastaticus]